LIAATVAVVLVGKPLAALAIVALFKYPLNVGMSVAVALAQVGEFSFIVSNLGTQLGVLPAPATDVLIAAAIVSITLNPLLFRAIGLLEPRLSRRSPASPQAEPAPRVARVPPSHRAIVVGYGPVGRTVTRLLRENEISPTIIELNVDTVRALKSDGIEALYGDAAHHATLASAGIDRANNLVVSIAGLPGVEDAFKVARELNPVIQILARANYLREVPALRAAGADVVVSGEGEVALGFTEAILERLGATPEQIDRERERVHAELGERS
jgi:CPA2 family monovalent cation:H+ antiporter-2